MKENNVGTLKRVLLSYDTNHACFYSNCPDGLEFGWTYLILENGLIVMCLESSANYVKVLTEHGIGWLEKFQIADL